MAMPGKINTVFSEDQNSAIGKALFINWILTYSKTYPDNFPEKPGQVLYEAIGNSKIKRPVLSRDEIITWHNANRSDNIMTTEEFDAIIAIQKRTGGMVVIDNCYYAILV